MSVSLGLGALRRPLRRKLLGLSTPVMLQVALTLALLQLDRVMIGQLGEAAIAGVGLSGQLLFALAMLFSAFATGCSILVSQYHGARQDEPLLATLGATVWLAVLLGGAVAAALAFEASALLRLFGVSAAVAEVGGRYLRVEALGLPAYLVGSVCASNLGAMGNTRIGFWVSGGSMALKLAVNLVLIFGAGPVPALGVVGAALGGVASQGVGTGIFLYVLMSRRWADADRRPALSPRELLRVRREPLLRILPLALPILVDMMVWQATGIAYSTLVATAGTSALAAYQVLLGIRNLGYVPVSGLPQAAEATIGQSLGRRRFHRAEASAAEVLRLSLAMAAVASLFLLVGAPRIAALYEVSPETLRIATVALMLFGAIQPFENANTVLPAILRVGGEPRAVMLISATTLVGVGLGGGYLLGRVLGFGIMGILCAMAAESIVKSALFLWRYRQGQWVRRLI